MSFDIIDSSILLYPNIVERDEEVTLSIAAPQSITITATLAHITGQVQPINLNLGDNIIKAPQVLGTYIVNIVLSNGTAKSLKFIVR